MKRVLMFTLIGGLLLCIGCENLQDENIRLRKQLDVAEDRIAELNRTVKRQTNELQSQRQQIETLQKLGDKRIDKLFTVHSIDIGRHTGGLDTDDKPGHDAIAVFLRTRGKQGATLKAAGSVKVQLFDLAADDGQRQIGEWTFDVDQAREHYASGIMSNHYSFELPLPTRPDHRELTLRVEFTDYLTGKTFSAQTALDIQLPPKQ